ncbi:hypothetical protein [Brevibacillus sp. AY1]|uniref:hypothetical protein n=1 Tax=Brevibacillus sp. AY1 TaxID=2807621 RepID=UPI002459048C|nr:hypothetical protein [Brevibacillus sp. AY1]MDH4615737.1 hypothetical protein [Brevibacillus sp. AY1]
MEIQRHERLLEVLKEQFAQQEAAFSFTQWDTENEDEEVSQFRGTLTELKLTDNEFDEKDLLLILTAEDGEIVEILMEIPSEEVDLAVWEEGRLSIFGTEAELVLEK